jgi:hypothetical protein
VPALRRQRRRDRRRDGNGVDDLAIGAPTASSSQNATGIVQILYAGPPVWIFADGFESGDPTAWSSSMP